ncbi:MAG: hypothetical protein ABGX16_25665, partial [Pirellulales bacterium]
MKVASQQPLLLFESDTRIRPANSPRADRKNGRRDECTLLHKPGNHPITRPRHDLPAACRRRAGVRVALSEGGGDSLRTKYRSISAKCVSNPELLRNAPLPDLRRGKLKGGQEGV